MSPRVRAAAAKARPSRLLGGHLPAPSGGLNTQAPGSAFPPLDAVQLYNLVAGELGLRSRLGYAEHAVGLTGAADNRVRTLVAYHGSAGDGSKDRLFAMTTSGIWRVGTAGAVAPAWAGSTSYVLGQFATDNSNVFGVVMDGVSDASAGLPATWAPTTVYVAGDRVLNDGRVYVCATGGTSDVSGGPMGTGSGIVDGTVVWDFQSPDTAIADGTVAWAYRAVNVAPTLVHAFGDTTGSAGIGVAHAFVTSGGHFLAYCDEVNGYLLYTESSDTWSAGSTTGVSAADLVFVTSWKHRLWFAERDSASAWYLGLNAISGAATQLSLSFAAKPRLGGALRSIHSWTFDGGEGIDDQIVFLFDGGDVAIYQGTDPGAAATFAIRGVWSLGGIPAGRRVGTPFGGDLLFLTKSGIKPLSQLTNGVAGGGLYRTEKISSLVNELMQTRSGEFGWAMHLHPEDNALLVTVPTQPEQPTEQLAQQLWNQSWSRYRDIPMLSAATWRGKLYFGTTDGRVCVHEGTLDNVRLASPTIFRTIQWSLLTGFQNLGDPRFKRVSLIRPTIRSQSATPNVATEPRYRYDTTELPSVSGAVATPGGWGTGLWGVAVWGGGQATNQDPMGGFGCGIDVAVAARGEAAGKTVVVGFDVLFQVGGYR